MTITMPTVRPVLSWETLEVGDDLGTVSGVVGEEAVRAHAFAIGDDPRRYLDGIDGVGPFVPPSLLSNELLKLFMIGYDCTPPWEGGFHTRSQIDYRAAIPIGSEITITGSHVAKFRSRGRRHRSCTTEARLRDGTVAVRMTATETMGYLVTDEPDEGSAPEDWARGWPRVEPGTVAGTGLLGPTSRLVGMAESAIFSGYPFAWAHETPQWIRAGLHTDPVIAARAGFGAPVVQGLVSASHHTSLLIEQFGERALRNTSLSLAFISSVLVGERLTSRAAPVSGLRDDADVLALVSTRGDGGDAVTVGYAVVGR